MGIGIADSDSDPESPIPTHGSNFSGKIFFLKYKLFYVVFYADSEYHVYFAPESTFDSENVEIQY